MDIELTASGYDSKGEAVCRYEGKVIFVPHVLSGEKILAVITKESKDHSRAKAIRLLKPSPFRTKPICPVFYQCGGCDLMHMTYDEQLRFKKTKVADALKRIAKIATVIHDVIGVDHPYEYRNKVRYAHEKGNIGFMAKMSHDIVSTKRCIICKKECDVIKNMLNEHIKKVPGLENLTVRKSCYTNDLSVLFESKRTLDRYPVKELTDVSGNITTIDSTDGKSTKNLYGKGYITEKLNNMTFKIYPNTFFQINTVQTEKLINLIRNIIDRINTKTAADIYCGTGTICLSIAERVDTVYGVDSDIDSIKAAKENAAFNRITNTQFICSKAEDIQTGDITYADTIILDPPRAGCHPKVIEWMTGMQPQNILYISCNPATLARDIKSLYEVNYTCKEVWPLDMFPQTVHVETVVLMSRVKE